MRYASDPGSDTATSAAMDVLLALVNATLRVFKIQAAEAQERERRGGDDGNTDPYEDLGNALVVYDLVFMYFFVAAGVVMVFTALLLLLHNVEGKGGKGRRMGLGKGESWYVFSLPLAHNTWNTPHFIPPVSLMPNFLFTAQTPLFLTADTRLD